VKAWVEAMNKAGLPINSVTQSGWAGTDPLIAAIKGATANGKTPTRTGLIDALQALGNTGQMGMTLGFGFEQGHHVGVTKFYIVTYKNGAFHTVASDVPIADTKC
jgi:hypothetical protein